METSLKKTKVIQLFGGPGSGKSCAAAEVFALLKKEQKSVELVREWVKGWAWEQREIKPIDQVYILAKQLKAETQLYGKVDYIVTDSPISLSAFYDWHYNGGSKVLFPVIANLLKQSDASRVNFVLQRRKDYVTEGRFESEEQAKEIDEKMLKFIEMLDFPFIYLTQDDAKKAEHIVRHLCRLS